MYTDRFSGEVTMHIVNGRGPRPTMILISRDPRREGWIDVDALSAPRPMLALPIGGIITERYIRDVEPAWFGGTTNEDGEVYGG